MASPLIGITTYRDQHKDGFPQITLPEAYVKAVSHVGGMPVLIPLGLSEIQLQDMLSKVDGIIFSGGGDINPDRYGGETHPELTQIDEDRDRVELHLFTQVIERKKPFLGICRGIQTANVAMGGTLYTHLPDQVPGGLHPPYDGTKPRNILAHRVEVQFGSKLAQVLGKENPEVNSLHHQGIKKLAPVFKATVHSDDGLVEGVELSDYGFGIAVQWHPEWLMDQQSMRSLFKEFVGAAAS